MPEECLELRNRLSLESWERCRARREQIDEQEQSLLNHFQRVYRDVMNSLDQIYNNNVRLARQIHAAATVVALSNYEVCAAADPHGFWKWRNLINRCNTTLAAVMAAAAQKLDSSLEKASIALDSRREKCHVDKKYRAENWQQHIQELGLIWEGYYAGLERGNQD